MLFGSGNDFEKNVTDSFGRFGIKLDNSEKGVSKNTIRLNMFDTIHDSSYVAVAVETPVNKKADVFWKDVIEKDLIPAIKAVQDGPAAALIIPTKDSDKVLEIFKERKLTPTVYQLFSGYIIAGFTKRDVERLVAENKEKEDDPPVNQDATPKTNPNPEPIKEINEIPTNKAVNKTDVKHKDMSLAKKLAAAALLGVGIGLIPFAIKGIIDKPENQIENIQAEPSTKAQEKYFTEITQGIPKDDELLKYIAANPQLAEKELRQLANTPVGTEAMQNPSMPKDILADNSKSEDIKRRVAVGSNENTPLDVLERLSRDPSPEVRSAVAKNPAITPDIMARLAYDEQGVKESLLENMQLPPNILDIVSSNSPRNCDFNKKLMANPCISPATLAYNANNPDPCIRAGVAANRNTPQELIDGLADDSLADVRLAAWKNPKISTNKISSIFNPTKTSKNSLNEAERGAALENPSIGKDIMAQAVYGNNGKDIKHIAKNPATPINLVNKIKETAKGKDGLKNFIDDAMKIKTDKNAQDNLKKLAKDWKTPVSVPLRKTLNADFLNKVYDPQSFARDMRAISRLDNKNNKEKTNNNISGNSIDFSIDKPMSTTYSLKNLKAVPEKFSDTPEYKENESVASQGEKAAFHTADAIIDNMMADILPAIENNGISSNQSGSSGSSQSNPQYNTGGTTGSNGGQNNTNNNTGLNSSIQNGINSGVNYSSSGGYNNSPEWIFQNACERIDELQSIF